MRIDINVDARSDECGGLIVLPRGSHVLLVQTGKPTRRFADILRRLVAGVRTNDASEPEPMPAQARLEPYVQSIELRVHARRNLRNIQMYHLLSEPDGRGKKSASDLQITTWEAFLATVEKNQDTK
jgi:hypothetical protein